MGSQQSNGSSNLRRVRVFELLWFPLRTSLVVTPVWAVYGLFQRFSPGDVTGLYDFALWLSFGLVLLSTGRTIVAVRGQPDSLLLRGAGHSARLPKRSNPQRAILTFRGLRADVYFSDPLPAEDVKVLRRLELFLLTPLRILAGTIVFWIVNNLVVFLTAGAGLTFVFNILWYTIVILYVIYVALQAIVPIIASGGPGFDDALRVRAWFRRFRR